MSEEHEDMRRFMRVRTLVEGSIETPISERTAWLERMCDGDEELLREVIQLLRRIEDLGDEDLTERERNGSAR